MTAVPAGARRLDRRSFVSELLEATPGALVVTGLGSSSYDVFAAAGPDRAHTFYLWGAMGAAVPLGLGLALAQPDRPVLVVTGDGEQLMGIGALATVAVQSPDNLTIVVLDNGHFGETGMQVSHTSLGTDLAAVAAGFGISTTVRISDPGEVATLAGHVIARRGTTFAQVLIAADETPRALPPRDGVANKNSFRASLGHPTF